MSQSLMLESTDTALWLKLVREAEDQFGIHLDSEMESYLVFMLMRQTGNPELAQDALAIEYLNTAELSVIKVPLK